MVVTLTNQTIYQCEHCGKRMLSKNGAVQHEKRWCKESPIVFERGRKIIESCEHEWQTHWTPIAGEEWRREPDHDYCGLCGVKDYELRDNTTNDKDAILRAMAYYEDHGNQKFDFTPTFDNEELPF